MALALRTSHYRCDADSRWTNDVATRLRDDTNSLGQLRQCAPQGGAKSTDVLDRLRVVDRKPSADIERVEPAKFLPTRRRHQLDAGVQRFDMFCGIRGLRP